MIPIRTCRVPRAVRSFDLVTPAGQVYRFPEPTWSQRAALWFSRFAEPILLSAVVMGLAYSAGFLAEALEPMAANHCVDQIPAGPETPA